MEKISFGLSENVTGALCYAIGWISGIVFVLIERESKFVRFHAAQSIIVFGPITLAFLSLDYIGEIGLTIGVFLMFITPVFWVVSMVKAYQGRGIWLKRMQNSA